MNRRSAVTDHAISLNHVIDWDQAKVIDTEGIRRQQSGQMDQGGDTYQEGARQVDEHAETRGLTNSPTSMTSSSTRN